MSKKFDYEKLCNDIYKFSLIFILVFLGIQVLYHILYSTLILEFLSSVFSEKVFMVLLSYYLFCSFFFILLYPFWLVFNIILEVIKLIKKKEKFKFINIIKIIICIVLYIISCWFFSMNIFGF